MPIYEFECTACGHGFQRLQRLSDADPDTCPACAHAGAIKRRLSAPSFRLAGSGWYETDFKNDKDKRRNLAGSDDAPPAAAGDKGADKSTDKASDKGADSGKDSSKDSSKDSNTSASAPPAAASKPPPAPSSPASPGAGGSA